MTYSCVTEIYGKLSQKREMLSNKASSLLMGARNCIKLRISAGDKNAGVPRDKAIADAYGNKFIIPLDFEMLDSAAPYYQAGLRNRLCYEIIFNDYNRVTKSAVSSPKVPDAKYKITDISLEYEIVTQPDLARSIRSESRTSDYRCLIGNGWQPLVTSGTGLVANHSQSLSIKSYYQLPFVMIGKTSSSTRGLVIIGRGLVIQNFCRNWLLVETGRDWYPLLWKNQRIFNYAIMFYSSNCTGKDW